MSFFQSVVEEKIRVDQEFKEKYKSFENVRDNIFQGHLQDIIDMGHEMATHMTSGKDYMSKVTGRIFGLRFL